MKKLKIVYNHNTKLGADKIEGASIGPNIYGAHTFEEKCEIKSIGVICNVVEEILKES